MEIGSNVEPEMGLQVDVWRDGKIIPRGSYTQHDV